jgi:hypothetical protein
MLVMWQTTFYRRFKYRYPDLKIGLTSFIKLRSFLVRTLKDRAVYYCKYHMEIIMIRDGVNAMRLSQDVHPVDHSCDCAVCDMYEDGGEGLLYFAKHMTYQSITLLWQECICVKDVDQQWHKRACLVGECGDCGVENLLSICPREEFGQSPMKWKCFEKTVVGVNEVTGEPRKRICEVYKQTSSAKFVTYLKPKLQKFIKHNFIASW